MKHVARCQLRLPIGAYFPFTAEKIPVTTNNLLGLRIPDNQLFAAAWHGVELVNVGRLASSSSCRAECYLAETAYLQHHIWSIVSRNDIYLVVALVGHSELLVRRKLAFQELLAYRLDNFFFHYFFGLSFLFAYKLAFYFFYSV